MELGKPAHGITALAVSRDGRYLLTGDNGGSMIFAPMGASGSFSLWDLSLGRLMFKKRDVSDIVLAVAISPDNKYAVTGGWVLQSPARGLAGAFRLLMPAPYQHIGLWNLTTGDLIKDSKFLSFALSPFRSVDFSPDGRYFLATNNSDILIFDAKTGAVIKTLTTDTFYVSLQGPVPIFPKLIAKFSPDGKHVLSGGADGVVHLFVFDTGKLIRKFKAHESSAMVGGISSVAFSPDGRFALTGAVSEEHVKLWDLETGVEVRRFSGFKGTNYMGTHYIFGVDFSPDGKNIFILSNPLKEWDAMTGKEVVDLSHAWQGVKIPFWNPSSGQFNPNGKDILATMNDAAIRILDAQSGEEKAMMVGFSDGEWIAITSEGYYNASENGAKYLSVDVGGRKYGVDMFYDVFYRPDIVAAKLKGEDISGLVSITMQDAIKSPPPVVEISPIASSPTSAKAKVCYNVKSTGGGIGEVRIFHNGKLIESDGYYKDMARTTSDKTHLLALNSRAIYEDMRSIKIKETGISPEAAAKIKGDAFSDCKEVDAISGENEISITAFNRDNTVQGHMQIARFTSSIKQEESHLYILLIGIDQYKDPSINLKYAVKDSIDIEEKLIKQAATLYRPQNIHYQLMTNTEANKTNITNKIDEISKVVNPTDGFILFVAGHGVLLQNQYYMLTYDYDGTVGEGGMISSNEIVEMSKRIKSLSQLFIFDTCHAGGVDYIVSGLYDARMSVLARKMGLHVYASASSKEAAMDGYEGNGLFTHALLGGLDNRREADGNKDSAVSIVELGEYSKATTAQISKTIGHSQTPLIINFGRDNTLYNLR